MKSIIKCLVVVLVCFNLSQEAFGQRYLADYDTSIFIRDTLRPFLRRFENLHFSAYMQPQFQVAQQKGVESFAGRDFSQFSNNRFMLRRARVKIDYILPAKKEFTPKALFTFQFEATERDL